MVWRAHSCDVSLCGVQAKQAANEAKRAALLEDRKASKAAAAAFKAAAQAAAMEEQAKLREKVQVRQLATVPD